MIAIAVTASGCNMANVKQGATSTWNKTTEFVKENSTVVGAVAGAVIGYAVSGKNDRGLGILAGAMIGGLIGDQLGKYLNEKERQELEAYSLNQLNTSSSVGSTQWASQSGAKATVQTGPSAYRKKAVEVVSLKAVEITPNLKLVGETYQSGVSLNVRTSPRVASYNKVGGLRPGAEFTAVGLTDNNWMLIAQNGISVGYVSAKYIQPASIQQTAMRSEGIDLDALDQEVVVAGIDLDGIDLDAVEVEKTEIFAQTECKTLDYDITSAEGQSGKASFNACKGADGAWELS